MRPQSRLLKHLFTALAAAALLVACGGGDDDDGNKIPITTRVVSFGDSLSDLGSYSPATSLTGNGAAPFFGGKFMTNTHSGYTAASNQNTAATWVEVVSGRLGVPIGPHEVGFGAASVKCPANNGTCTGYAQGGSRVTDPNGIGRSGGALTVPMVTQVANHNTRFNGFGAGDLVLVWGGNNDAFIQLGAVGQGVPVATALGNMDAAATQLANLIKNEMIAKGAQRVAVMNLPDASNTPGFLGADAQTRGLLAQLSAQFNTTLNTALSGVPQARIIDARGLIGAVATAPATYGLTNVTEAACDPAKISAITRGGVTDGSSLFCNATAGAQFNGLKTGASASTWFFADTVHPTTGGHKVIGDIVYGRLQAAGWVQ
jgi:outer membrane lipase/esterase